MNTRWSALAAILVSLALHAGLGASLRTPVYVGALDADASYVPVQGPLAARERRIVSDASRAELTPGAPTPRTNIDTEAAPGASESAGGSLIWIQALPAPTAITLQDADFNSPYASQLQRIDSATERASLEMRRQTPHPADAVFLASGRRGPNERVPEARRWPAPGAVRGAEEAVGAGGPDTNSAGREDEATPAAPPTPSALSAGMLRTRGSTPRHAAPRAFARPSIDRGSAGTLATVRDGRVRDDEAAEQLAAVLQRSMVDTTRTRADRTERAESGSAEVAGGVGLASAGTSAGSRAHALRPGAGELGLLDTRDARYIRWFGQQRARVAEHLTFPRARALSMDQGQTLVFVRVLRSGAFAVAPSLYRTSGYAEFDAAALRAVRDAGSFAPVPDEILPGEAALSLLVPIKFDNPMVR